MIVRTLLSGGHLAAYEKREEFVDDLVRFFPSVWEA